MKKNTWVMGLCGIVIGFVLCRAIMPQNAAIAEPMPTVFSKILENRTIRCGYSVWPPYFIKDPNSGKLSGINYEQVEAIGQQLDLKIDWAMEIGWGEVASALNSGKVDMMCASLWPDAARTKLMTFTSPLFFTPAYVFVRADESRFTDSNSMNNASVQFAGIEGDITYNAVKNNFPNARLLALPQTADPSQLLEHLTTGKVDAILMDQAFGRNYAEQNPGKIKFAFAKPVQIFGEYFAIKQGEVAFKNVLDVAIETMVNSGKAQEILTHYKNYSVAPKPSL